MAGSKSWKSFLVDTLATISASFPAGLFNEVVIAGMTLGQSLYARFIAIWIDLFTARPYGIYRDFIFTHFGITDASALFKKDTNRYLFLRDFPSPCLYLDPPLCWGQLETNSHCRFDLRFIFNCLGSSFRNNFRLVSTTLWVTNIGRAGQNEGIR